MSDIAKARSLLETALTDPNPRPFISRALRYMYREPYIRKAPVRSRRITKAIVLKVKDYAKRNPDMHLRDIGQEFDIDGGRVSEILNGKWDGLLL